MNDPNKQKDTTPQPRDVVREPKGYTLGGSYRNRQRSPNTRFRMRTLFTIVTLSCIAFAAYVSYKNRPIPDPLAKTESEQPTGPSIRELTDESKLVKELLDVDAHVFAFSGAPLRVWLEAETKVEGEETIVRHMLTVEVTRSDIDIYSPDNTRGKFIVSGKVFESPSLRMIYNGGASWTQGHWPAAVVPPWPKNVPLHGGYRWECPSELPGEGQVFVIASFNKKLVEGNIFDPNFNLHDAKVLRETTIKIKGMRLHRAPEPATEEIDAIAEIKKFGGRGSLNESGEVIQVDFGHTQVTGAGLEHLKGLTSLNKLSLMGTKITDAGLEHLKGMTSLTELNLISGTNITDAGMEHLKGLTSLNRLLLSNMKITDAGLEHLKGLTSLTSLWLSNTKITDAGLEHLKGMTSLTELNLHHTRITDAGLEHLKGLTSLKSMDLRGTQVTDAGLSKLKAALPKCKVRID